MIYLYVYMYNIFYILLQTIACIKNVWVSEWVSERVNDGTSWEI